MKKNIMKLALLVLLIIPLSVGLALPARAAALPNWNAVGTYQWMASGIYSHDLVITSQNTDGTFVGTGGYPAGSMPYTATGQTPETITGQVTGDNITLTTTYTGPYNSGYSATLVGTIAADGTMSGTAPFEWHTTSGKATAITSTSESLAAQDFGVVNYDTGLGILKGYTAGFGLTNATFAGVQSVVVQLYSGTTLLQTNTATSKVGATLTGADISSPFDVSGTFNYATDGYWTNVRETQYGQSMPATRVVATVKLADSTVVTAENTNLTGDPTTIYPTTTSTAMLTSLTLTPATNQIAIAGTTQLTASPMDQNGASFTGATTMFYSTNSTTATVSSSGLVTGVANGTAYIVAVSTSGSTTVVAVARVYVGTGQNIGKGDDQNENEGSEAIGNNDDNGNFTSGNQGGGSSTSTTSEDSNSTVGNNNQNGNDNSGNSSTTNNDNSHGGTVGNHQVNGNHNNNNGKGDN